MSMPLLPRCNLKKVLFCCCLSRPEEVNATLFRLARGEARPHKPCHAAAAQADAARLFVRLGDLQQEQQQQGAEL